MAINSVVIDFETRSDVPIDRGIWPYACGKHADILMMAYKVNDKSTKIWERGQDLPAELFDDSYYIVAHNADFENTMWQVRGPLHGFPQIPYSRFIDTAALCRRYGLPSALAAAGKALGLKEQKQEIGKQLIKLFSMPPFADSEQYPREWQMFKEYCMQDVETTYAVWNALPAKTLTPEEEAIRQLNRVINTRGIPIDVESAKQIYACTSVFLEENNRRLPKLTNGKVEKVTQVKRIKEWCNSQLEDYGIVIDSLNKEALEELLSMDLPGKVMEVLEIRAGTGLSSIGKYKRMVEMEHCGVIHDNSIYYGAHTGRITGNGFQLLNLPRASVEDPEAEIQKFFDYTILEENPVLSARTLVRAMIKAPEGKKLLVADYSSVEYIAECWLAEEFEAVENFANGKDQYKDMAAFLYNTTYDKVDKEERRIGKTIILGCGYGLGIDGFISYAKRNGLKISVEEAANAVNSYRQKYNRIRNMWYALDKCAKAAVQFKGQEFIANKTKFKCAKDHVGHEWLVMTLPSGRNMFYMSPELREGTFGENVTHMARNQVTKQWERRFVSPGLLTENVIQAMCRDLLYYGKMQLEKVGYEIVGSIYDEVIACVPQDFGSVEEFCTLMATTPEWAKGLPLKAEGFETQRYRKG